MSGAVSNLATYRKHRGLSQAGLAALAGVHQTNISDIECGRNTNPSWRLVSRLADVLDVTERELFPCSPTAIQQEPESLGSLPSAEVLENALIELDHWREIATEYRVSLHLCDQHHPSRWEDDGTCPICQAHRLKAAAQKLVAAERSFLGATGMDWTDDITEAVKELAVLL